MKRLLAAALILLTLAGIGNALTRGEIREQIRYDILDTTDTVNINTRFSDEMLNKRINIIQAEVVAYTRCLYGRCFVTPVADQPEYRMPTDCLVIDRVSYLNTTTSTTSYKRLPGRTMSGLDIEFPAWESNTSGLPRYYYKRRNYIGLYPKPSATFSQARALKIDYFKRADDLTADSDVPFDGDYALYLYHRLIALGVVIMCKQTMGVDYALDLQKYTADLEVMKNNLKTPPDIQETIQVAR